MTLAKTMQPKKHLFFFLAKWISLTIATLAIVVSVIAVFMILKTFSSASISMPEFKAEDLQKNRYSLSRSLNDPQAQKEMLEITSQYGQKILGVITRNEISAFKVNDIVELLQQSVPQKYHQAYVIGWEKFMDQGVSYLKTNSPRDFQTGIYQLSEYYHVKFKEALSEAENETLKKQAERATIFYVFGMCLMLFIGAMIVPLLVAIERNTRPLLLSPAAALPENSGTFHAPRKERMPQGKTCPQCGATINEGDTFCGECGAHIA